MIIYGWSRRPRVDFTGRFHCPVCNLDTDCTVQSSKTWFTLFFIPLFPISGSGPQTLVCGSCGTSMSHQLMQARAAQNSQIQSIGSDDLSGSKSTNSISALKRVAHRSGFGTVSLVFALLSLPLVLTCFGAFFASIVAIITGHIAFFKDAKFHKPWYASLSPALFGISIGYFVLTLSSVVLGVTLVNVLNKRAQDLVAAGPLDVNVDDSEAVNTPVTESGPSESVFPLASETTSLIDSITPPNAATAPQATELPARVAEVSTGSSLHANSVAPESASSSNDAHDAELEDNLNPFVEKKPTSVSNRPVASEVNEVDVIAQSSEDDDPFASSQKDIADTAGDEMLDASLPDGAMAEDDGFSPMKLDHIIPNDGWGVNSLMFSNDDRWIIAGGMDGGVTIYDAKTRQLMARVELQSQMSSIDFLAISSKGDKLIAGGGTGMTGMINLSKSGKLTNFVSLSKHTTSISALVASPKHNFFASGSSSGAMYWEPLQARSKARKELGGFKSKVHAIHLPANGDLAMATDGAVLIAFSLKNGKIERTIQLGLSHGISGAFSADAKSLLISDFSSVIEFDTATGEKIATYLQGADNVFWKVGYHPTKPWLFAGGSGKLFVCQQGDSDMVASIPIQESTYIQQFSISNDNRKLITVPAISGGDLYLFDLEE